MALDPGMGNCGKQGQWVPVGVGQPTLLIGGLTVGGSAAGGGQRWACPCASRWSEFSSLSRPFPNATAHRNGGSRADGVPATWQTAVAVLTVVLPAVFGFLLGVPLVSLIAPAGSTAPGAMLAAVIAVQAVAPLLSVWFIVPGLVAAALLLRAGWFGWAMAALSGATMAVAGLALYDMATGGPFTGSGYAVFWISGAIHGLAAWLTLCGFRPEAVLPRVNHS